MHCEPWLLHHKARWGLRHPASPCLGLTPHGIWRGLLPSCWSAWRRPTTRLATTCPFWHLFSPWNTCPTDIPVRTLPVKALTALPPVLLQVHQAALEAVLEAVRVSWHAFDTSLERLLNGLFTKLDSKENVRALAAEVLAGEWRWKAICARFAFQPCPFPTGPLTVFPFLPRLTMPVSCRGSSKVHCRCAHPECDPRHGQQPAVEEQGPCHGLHHRIHRAWAACRSAFIFSTQVGCTCMMHVRDLLTESHTELYWVPDALHCRRHRRRRPLTWAPCSPLVPTCSSSVGSG